MTQYSLLVLITVFAACRGPQEIRAADYDTSCVTDTDCVVVHEGQCSGCGKPYGYGAINVSEHERYQTDYAALDCDPDPDIICDRDTDPRVAVCIESVCVAQRAI
jgi:hypothetical protein